MNDRIMFLAFYDWFVNVVSGYDGVSYCQYGLPESNTLRLSAKRNGCELFAIYFHCECEAVIAHFYHRGGRCTYEYINPESFDQLESDIRAALMEAGGLQNTTPSIL